jgi:hypothetical protein
MPLGSENRALDWPDLASYHLDTDRRHPKYFDLLPNFNPGKIAEGE